jgi:hypothetical protein
MGGGSGACEQHPVLFSLPLTLTGEEGYRWF